jgi:hypothetical protein
MLDWENSLSAIAANLASLNVRYRIRVAFSSPISFTSRYPMAQSSIFGFVGKRKGRPKPPPAGTVTRW